jgi:hypothetical protein
VFVKVVPPARQTAGDGRVRLGARPIVAEAFRAARFRPAEQAANEAIVGTVHRARLERVVGTLRSGVRAVAHALVAHFATTRAVLATTLAAGQLPAREVRRRGEVLHAERPRRLQVARRGTPSRYRVGGARSSPKIVRVGLLETARNTARQLAGTCLVVRVLEREDRLLPAREDQVPATDGQLSGCRVRHGRGRKPIERLVVVRFVDETWIKESAATTTDSDGMARPVAPRVIAWHAQVLVRRGPATVVVLVRSLLDAMASSSAILGVRQKQVGVA